MCTQVKPRQLRSCSASGLLGWDRGRGWGSKEDQIEKVFTSHDKEFGWSLEGNKKPWKV